MPGGGEACRAPEGEHTVFDSEFFQVILPSYVESLATGHRDQVPVLQVHLADGSVLDICRIVGAAAQWVAVAFFREPLSCDEVDIAFLRYNLITRVTVCLPHRSARTIGFNTMPDAAPHDAALPSGIPSGAR